MLSKLITTKKSATWMFYCTCLRIGALISYLSSDLCDRVTYVFIYGRVPKVTTVANQGVFYFLIEEINDHGQKIGQVNNIHILFRELEVLTPPMKVHTIRFRFIRFWIPYVRFRLWIPCWPGFLIRWLGWTSVNWNDSTECNVSCQLI